MNSLLLPQHPLLAAGSQPVPLVPFPDQPSLCGHLSSRALGPGARGSRSEVPRVASMFWKPQRASASEGATWTGRTGISGVTHGDRSPTHPTQTGD